MIFLIASTTSLVFPVTEEIITTVSLVIRLFPEVKYSAAFSAQVSIADISFMCTVACIALAHVPPTPNQQMFEYPRLQISSTISLI